MPAIVRRPRAGWSPARRCKGLHNEGEEGVRREKGMKEPSQTAGGPGPADAARLQLIMDARPHRACQTPARAGTACYYAPARTRSNGASMADVRGLGRRRAADSGAGSAGRLWWVGPTGAAIKTSCHPPIRSGAGRPCGRAGARLKTNSRCTAAGRGRGRARRSTGSASCEGFLCGGTGQGAVCGKGAFAPLPPFNRRLQQNPLFPASHTCPLSNTSLPTV